MFHLDWLGNRGLTLTLGDNIDPRITRRSNASLETDDLGDLLNLGLTSK
jgi:hypothetical protein